MFAFSSVFMAPLKFPVKCTYNCSTTKIYSLNVDQLVRKLWELADIKHDANIGSNGGERNGTCIPVSNASTEQNVAIESGCLTFFHVTCCGKTHKINGWG